MDEPDIRINGVKLTVAQAMTVRVALNSFGMEMQQDGALGEDEQGKTMSALYLERVNETLNLMHK